MLDFAVEQAAYQQGFNCVCGVDEVGRGPWAGPVVAAAVILDPRNIPQGLNDSKKVPASKRALLYDTLLDVATVSIAEASVEEIDALNILQASMLAMERAVAGLSVQPDMALIDGNRLPKSLPCNAQAFVKGDAKVLSIAAASIVAKVYRDRLMADLAYMHPHYSWETNAGYGTAAHQAGLRNVGITEHHRRSFRPIQAYLSE
jgi:ribonuclease HII